MEGFIEAAFLYEPIIRGGSFLFLFALFALAEVLVPRRRTVLPRRLRWTNNIGVVAVDTLLLRLVFPAAAVGAAVLAEERGWGVLNLWNVPALPAVLLSILFLDLTLYLQHVIFHAVPALWRLHRMHHMDQDFDVTTGVRFHPVEILLSMLIKYGAVFAVGAPPVAVLLFEVLLNGTSMFNHSNVRLPLGLDRVLRWMVVTPDMHRVHHSVHKHETNSNFGFNLPWWDRLLGTYRDQPQDGHVDMVIGINSFRSRLDQRLDRMLWSPMVGSAGEYPINRRWEDGQ